ncbi:histone [candidate division MSBL1 archaeon SCGC-AAA259B11]|uniref:Histone n=1 Tax=candidate division MSBL1 archaeon SCGC-AAA259B11 TaxID=1698260 RepID=A0A133U8Y3_9EURY|nr:histone [candidate division MSBL1 archaeon SCGC-AAA259B11]
MLELPETSVDRIIRRAGGIRVSKTAAKELTEIIEKYALEIATEATTLAKHAGRKTVRDVDIRLALKR